MIICEHAFDREDPSRPGYSQLEVDFYAWIPRKWHRIDPNHRLSLRKNLRTGEFELYKHYYLPPRDVVVFRSKDLGEVLEVANGLWNKYHHRPGEEFREPDRVCQHRPPVVASDCPIYHGRKGG